MHEATAITVAIDLIRVPSQVRRIRSQPLPDGIVEVLRIAAGDQDAEQKATEATGRSLGIVREASLFFIEQILLASDSDNYRILGTTSNATAAELRRNMILLLKGMHPDLQNGVHSLFARRVLSAWETLKTPERRAIYDLSLQWSDRRLAKKERTRLPSRKDWLTRQSIRQFSRTYNRERTFHRAESRGLLHRVWQLFLAAVRA